MEPCLLFLKTGGGFTLGGLAVKNRLAVLTRFWDAPETCYGAGQGLTPLATV